MPTDVAGDLQLQPIDGEARTLAEWTTTFHLVLVVLDPFTFESAWVLETAGRVLGQFGEADCRVAWLVAGSIANAKQFLGPWAKEILTFVDPDRSVVNAIGLERVPAFVHLNLDHAIEAKAEGWQPDEWQEVADQLAKVMSWSAPTIARLGGPTPYEGSPVSG